MSEFIAVMGGSGNEYTVCEHTTTRVLTGEAEAVRPRLVYALESLGYTVVSDNPVHARRPRRKDIVRADFTDHAWRLAVGLRQGGAAGTQVTFDFAITLGSARPGRSSRPTTSSSSRATSRDGRSPSGSPSASTRRSTTSLRSRGGCSISSTR